MRWVINESNLIPQKETKLSIPYDFMGNVCIAENDSMIILVDDDRVLYELDSERLDVRDTTLATSMSSSTQNQPYCQRFYKVSSDGLRLVVIHIQCPKSTEATTCDRQIEHPTSPDLRKTRIELRFVELTGTNDPIRTIELEYSDPYTSTSHQHVAMFSPDLSLLQAGLHIFDLLSPGYPQLSFPDSPLADLRSIEDCVSFSACNRYLAIIKAKKGYLSEGSKARLGFFWIFRTAGRIERLVIANLEGLVADKIFAAFHPMLPLLMLTHYNYPRTEVQGSVTDVEVMEVDLEGLESSSFAHTIFDISKADE